MGCFIRFFGGRKHLKNDIQTSGSRNLSSTTHSSNSEKRGPENNRKGIESKPNLAINEGGSKERTRKLIAVVGRTGSGLSQFIHDATGEYEYGVAPDASLQPYTRDFKAISTTRGNVTLIDTPGFDYSRGNDEHTTFKKLAEWLRRQYGSKVKLDGVIYMHNIWNEEIYHRSKFISSEDLEGLCGPFWREKMILVNSHWSERLGEDGEDREEKLREGYWSFMIGKGSRMMRYESPGDWECAREILELLL